MTNGKAKEFIVQSVKSDADMAKVADAINAIEKEPSINDTLNKIKNKIALLKHLNTDITVYRWWNNAIDNCIHEIDYYITENEVEE